MGKNKLQIKDLHAIGYRIGSVVGIALNIVQTNFRHRAKTEKLALLKAVFDNPNEYINHNLFSPIAHALLAPLTQSSDQAAEGKQNELLPNALPFDVFGQNFIEEGAMQQMFTAMKLPITVAGALMPDGHQGYGLPIGGVLATKNAVIPYGVGVDIGCRMCLTAYQIPPEVLKQKTDDFAKILLDNTIFGAGGHFKKPMDNAVFEREEFKYIDNARTMKDTAVAQIGTSGSGNHFVEFGILELTDPNNEWQLEVGSYLAVLSHSGSRGLGAKIANHFTKLAMQHCRLPKEAQHLAWLDLASGDGHEYWAAMNLAGDYASACHHQIHFRIQKALGENPALLIENHHNFAWKEQLPDGTPVIVHRKGATPAGKGVLGIIPGSMTAPGYIVRGKGLANSINSASHGAGRQMSRNVAKKSILPADFDTHLKQHGVTLIGGNIDEAPMAYKDINMVMAAQKALVDVIGKFIPRIVRMA